MNVRIHRHYETGFDARIDGCIKQFGPCTFYMYIIICGWSKSVGGDCARIRTQNIMMMEIALIQFNGTRSAVHIHSGALRCRLRCAL